MLLWVVASILAEQQPRRVEPGAVEWEPQAMAVCMVAAFKVTEAPTRRSSAKPSPFRMGPRTVAAFKTPFKMLRGQIPVVMVRLE
jgi:hypothetical protein